MIVSNWSGNSGDSGIYIEKIISHVIFQALVYHTNSFYKSIYGLRFLRLFTTVVYFTSHRCLSLFAAMFKSIRFPIIIVYSKSVFLYSILQV